MVLGFLLYEAVDVVYNVGRVGWNGVAGAYRWYYGIEEETDRESGHSLTDAEVAAIVDRLAKLEALVATALPLGDQGAPPPCQPPSSSDERTPTGALTRASAAAARPDTSS